MTDEQIAKLFELKKKFDSGEISKETFDLGVSEIRGTDNETITSPEQEMLKKRISTKKRNIIIASIAATVLLFSLGLFLILQSNHKAEADQANSSYVSFPDEDTVKDVIGRYCSAICDNDFGTLTSLYAPFVKRFQDAYNKDRDYVIGCHQRYDDTFKVYGKDSHIRWDSFIMKPEQNGTVDVTIVEDYSIDREDKSKYSVFVLEKHFIIDSTYRIVSVYDNQLSRSKGVDLSIDQLSMIAYYYVLMDYAQGSDPTEVGMVYNRVDFRKNVYFRNLIRKVVKSNNDFHSMMNSAVIFTEYMDLASGKIGVFEIQGDGYTISFSRYLGEELSITVSVNGKEYNWESPDYMCCSLYPTESNYENNYSSKSGLTESDMLELFIRSEFGDERATLELINAIIMVLTL